MSTWSLTGVAKTSDCDNVHRVQVGLGVPTPPLASQSLLLRAPGQTPGDCLARPIAPA